MPESTVLLKPGAYKDTLACVGGDTRNLCRQSRSVCVTENRRHRGADRLFVGMCVLNVYACVCVRMYACMHAMCRFFYAPHSKYVFVNGSVCIGVTSSETGWDQLFQKSLMAATSGGELSTDCCARPSFQYLLTALICFPMHGVSCSGPLRFGSPDRGLLRGDGICSKPSFQNFWMDSGVGFTGGRVVSAGRKPAFQKSLVVSTEPEWVGQREHTSACLLWSVAGADFREAFFTALASAPGSGGAIVSFDSKQCSEMRPKNCFWFSVRYETLWYEIYGTQGLKDQGGDEGDTS